MNLVLPAGSTLAQAEATVRRKMHGEWRAAKVQRELFFRAVPCSKWDAFYRLPDDLWCQNFREHIILPSVSDIVDVFPSVRDFIMNANCASLSLPY